MDVKVHPCILQDISPLEPLPYSHFATFIQHKSRVTGTSDHMQSLDDLFFVPVLRIEGLIDFIEEIKGSGIAFLDGENEGESDEGLLTA